MNDAEIRLSKILRKLDISLKTAIDFLKSKGIVMVSNPNLKINQTTCALLVNKFCYDNSLKLSIVSDLMDNIKEKHPKIILTNSGKLSLNEHVKFKIIEQKDRSTILLNERTGLTYACKKISKLVNDNVVMQINSLDSLERPSMKYSVLNDFIEGKEYEFGIVDKIEKGFIIENSEDYTSFIPLSFEKHIVDEKKIKLTIDRIDKEKNHLIFQSKNTFNRAFFTLENDAKDATSLFKLGEKYEFKVEGFRVIDEDISIILLDYQGYKSTVKSFSFQNKDNLPETIVCIVAQVSEDKIKLFQDRYNLLLNLYKEGNKHEFNVVSQENDSNNNSKYFILTDKYGFTHKLYSNDFDNDEFEDVQSGQNIWLYVKRIDEKGHVVLNIDAPERHGSFTYVESIFEFINKSDEIDRYFYFIRDELKKDIYKEKHYVQLFEDYEKRENLWVFSYLSFLNEYIHNSVKENLLEIAIEFSDLYLEIEEWMLEGSDFLQKFSPEKRPTIIQKAEQQLKNARIRKEALILIKNQQSEHYIQDVLKTLRVSSYLRDDKVNIFKNLIFNTSHNNLKNTSEIVEIILLLNKGDLLNTFDVNNFIGILEYKINIEKYDLNPVLLNNGQNLIDDETKNALQNIIKILGLQIILNNKNKNYEIAILKSAIMFRYLSHLTNDENIKISFLNKAIKCIVTSQSISLKTDLVANFDINIFNELVIENQNAPKEYVNSQVYNNNGAIYSTRNGWAILSRQQLYNGRTRDLKLNTLKSFFNNSICISSHYDIESELNIDNNLNINDCTINWKKYFTNLEIKRIEVNNLNSDLSAGQSVRVIAKNYMKNNNKILFLKIMEPNFEGEGIINLNDIFRKNIEDFEDVINSGDELTVEIKKIDEAGITFTMSNEIWIRTLDETNIDDVVDAKVMHIYANIAFLITENGHFASIYIGDKNNEIQERKVYKFKIIDLNSNKSTLGLAYIANSERNFNEKQVLRNFLVRTGIISVSEVEIDNSKKIEKLLSELINCIENIMHFEKDNLRKVECLQLLKLLSSVNKSPKSFYFESLINYYLNIYNFKQESNNEISLEFEPIDEKTTSIFKSLEVINDRYKYLNLFNKLESIPELIALRKEVENAEELKLINMLLAHNLLKFDSPNDVILLRTKDLIFEFLSNEKVDTFNDVISVINNDFISEEKEVELVEEILHLGKEGTYREFKTSFVYYAGNNSLDIEKQSSIIMKTIAGFLNSKGGSLFIGVNDSGEIIGLQNDYDYFGKSATSDKFEREIRATIVKSFNKDVNSHIEFKFLSSNNLEYCEIIIPSYDKPVSYFDNFYQRQGNETRVITGNDLIFFFERKFSNGLSNENNLIFKINREENDNHPISKHIELEQPIQINLFEENVDFYSDQKSENNNLNIDYNIATNSIIAYMYIYINGKYIISRKKLDIQKSAEEVLIYNNFKKGFLLQCYDNGCVNKIEVRTILEKTLGRIYSNGFSLQGNLVGLFLIQEDCLLQVNTMRNNIEYVKVVDTEIISTHNQLNLKGNNIVQEDFDLLTAFKIIDKSHREKLNRITYKSKQSLGVKVDKLSYKNEMEYLSTIN
ncbi:ATP-binding protein [Flavobacterium sp. XS2P24]|uniref:RNA-binding domain-containing protein n=1 Tax=Flavobacterium sp. XS2P24 TaxID=3041249 RepID=UPI0024A7F66D|nr:ATP-binding protein [Flavobacterium sp. XS2P24]MDI6050964.1 ATP-binding protein [Flavobacterium sp. XS2P24]